MFRKAVGSPYFFTILFTIIILWQNLAFSSGQVSEIDDVVKSGLSEVYNFDWASAEKSFDEIIKEYPHDPRGYLYKSLIYLWYYLGSKNKSNYDNFVFFSDSAIEKAQNILDKAPNNHDMLFAAGLAYTYRAIVFTEAESYLDAAWATKKSESYFSSLLDADSSYYDAYLGLGIYNFVVGQIPAAFKWALRLAGIHGEESTGITYLKLAAKKGKYTSVEAQYYLSQIYSEVIADYNSSENLLSGLVKKYPDNLLFNYSYASLEIKKRNLDDAKNVLNKILTLKTKHFSQIIAYSDFLMGEVLFRENNFSKATDYYLRFLASTSKKDYAGMAAYRLGICYDISGDTTLAKNYFYITDKGNMDIDDDIYAARRGKLLLSEGLDSLQIYVIKQENNFNAGNFKTAHDSLIKIIPLITNDDLKAEALLYLSKSSLQLKLYDEAIQTAEKIDTINIKEEKWLQPFAFYTIAQAYKQLDNQDDYHDYLDKAADAENYDYENQLKDLIYASKFEDKMKVSVK
jgi:Iml2/Tetratricopeptide repeat protein 39